jgi:hypothetical protein
MAKSPVVAFETLSTLFHRKTGKPAAKWQGYLQHYDRLFSGLKTKPLRILEIGIQAGGSLEVWAQYFESALQIIGCDKDPACGNLSYTDSRIHVLIGDINAPETLHSLTVLTETLDLVIDDGSHHSEDIIRSFVQIFPRLSGDGIYLIEDLHCSYWESYGGGLYDPFSAISFFKKIVDIINRPMWGVAINAHDFFADFKFIASATQPENAWDFLAEIHSIEFVNSMCIIHKRPIKDNALGLLTLSGRALEKSAEGVVKHDSKHYIAGEIAVPNQSTNVFSTAPSQQISDQLLAAHEEIASLKRQNASLSTHAHDAAKKYYDASVANEKLTSEVYGVTKKYYDSSLALGQLTTQVYEATKKYYDSSVIVDQLTTQFYEVTKKYYEASVTIQQLEYQLNQLEHSKLNPDSDKSQNP